MCNLYVVITDFNGFSRTQLCLEALRAERLPGITVIVVDHGTTPETRLGIEAGFPEVVRVEASSALWWTGATNCGIRYALAAGADAVMLLNSDCYMLPGSLRELLRIHAANPGAIVAPVQRELPSGRIVVLAARSLFLLGFPTLKGPCRLTPAQESAGVLPTALIVGGRGAIIPAAHLAQLGLFDEVALPHYGADHDFYHRARAIGIPLLIATRASIAVDASSTTLASDTKRLTLAQFRETLTSVRSHQNLRDVTTLFRRHYPVPGFWWIGVCLYTGRYTLLYALRRALFLLRGRGRD